MECIAASQRPSERVLGFYSGNLICIYCTVAIKMDIYHKELLQLFLELTHGQIKQQIVHQLVKVVVVWGRFFPPLQIYSALPRHCLGFTRLRGHLTVVAAALRWEQVLGDMVVSGQ